MSFQHKYEMKTGDKTDLWRHFGKVLIRGPNKGDVDFLVG